MKGAMRMTTTTSETTTSKTVRLLHPTEGFEVVARPTGTKRRATKSPLVEAVLATSHPDAAPHAVKIPLQGRDPQRLARAVANAVKPYGVKVVTRSTSDALLAWAEPKPPTP